MGRNPDDNAERRAEAVDALTRAALELFAEYGIEGTTMAAIARRAGCSKGLTYHYFPSKDALVAAVVRQRVDHVRALASAVPADLPARARLEAVARAVVDDVVRDPARFRLYLRVLARPDGPDSVRPAVPQGGDDELVTLLADLGSCEPAADARFFRVGLLGIATHLATSPTPADPDALVRRLVTAVTETR